jgi:sec-independent protein translocase protein TatA
MLTQFTGLAQFAGLFGFLTSPIELIVLSLVILLLFGNRLPGVMRGMGQGIMEFKKGVQGIEDQGDADKNKNDSASKTAAK